MEKKILSFVCTLFLFVVLITNACSANNLNTTTSEDYIPSEIEENTDSTTEVDFCLLPQENERIITEDTNQLQSLIDDCDIRISAANKIIDGCNDLGYEENHPIILLAQQERNNAEEDRKYYQTAYDIQIKKQEEIKKANEKYPVARQIWDTLKSAEYNDYVCAGIIGNMMAEVGGQTLDIKPLTQTKSYYGICQWNKAYANSVWGTDLTTQLNFLINGSIKYELNTYGYMYKSKFNYEKFLSLTNEKDAALAFAKSYERCSSASYSQRQKNATTAYNYFVN